jgi:hypothetical protein
VFGTHCSWHNSTGSNPLLAAQENFQSFTIICRKANVASSVCGTLHYAGRVRTWRLACLYSEIALFRKPFGIEHRYIYIFLLRMTGTMTSHNIDLSSWDILYELSNSSDKRNGFKVTEENHSIWISFLQTYKILLCVQFASQCCLNYKVNPLCQIRYSYMTLE